MHERHDISPPYPSVVGERLFASPRTLKCLHSKDTDHEKAKQLNTFVAGIARLQDTVSDKFMLALLLAPRESIGAVFNNLDRTELDWIGSPDGGLESSRLRGHVVQDCLDDVFFLASNLRVRDRYIPMLIDGIPRLIDSAARRGWV